MDLYVLRHGVAAERDWHEYPNDDERPLTQHGITKLTHQVKGLNALNLSLDLMISSPLLRSTQTAQIVRRRPSKTRRASDIQRPSAGGASVSALGRTGF